MIYLPSTSGSPFLQKNIAFPLAAGSGQSFKQTMNKLLTQSSCHFHCHKIHMAVANTWSKSMKWQISIHLHTPQLIKIPTSSYACSPKKVPLFGRVSLYRELEGVATPPPPPPRIKWLGELRSTTSYFTQTWQQNFSETADKNTHRNAQYKFNFSRNNKKQSGDCNRHFSLFVLFLPFRSCDVLWEFVFCIVYS